MNFSVADGLTVRPSEPLARHTALRTGGPCDVWVIARDLTGVASVVADCRTVGWKLTVLGAGTRTVVRDGPVAGAVLRLGGDFLNLTVDAQGLRITAGAAVPVPVLVSVAARAGLSGLEGFAGIPGTLGASVLLDEGWDEHVEVLSVLRRGSASDETLTEARRKKALVLGAVLRGVAADPGEVLRRTASVWSQSLPGAWYERLRREPLRATLAGARLPLVRLRQVAIPLEAPELLVNLGQGTAADLALLHRAAVERVRKVRGVELTSRVRWLGTAASAEEEGWSSGVGGSES